MFRGRCTWVSQNNLFVCPSHYVSGALRGIGCSSQVADLPACEVEVWAWHKRVLATHLYEGVR